MPVAPDLGFLGVAKESVKGTAVAATAYPPIRVGRVWQDELMQLDDDGMRGSMIDGPFDQLVGPIFSTFQCDGPAFPDTAPWFGLGILGDVATLASRSVADGVTNATTLLTSATAAFTQADIGRPITASADFAAGTFIVTVTSTTSVVLNKVALSSGAAKTITIGNATTQWHHGAVKNSTDGQPTSITLTDFYGLTGGTPARQFAGAQTEEFTLKWAGEGLAEFTAKLKAFASATASKPSVAPSTVQPMQGWALQPVIAGTASVVCLSGELTWKRNTNPIHTADGTQAPYKIWQGGLSLGGKLTFVAEDDSEYLRYLNHTTPVVILNWINGTAAATGCINVTMSKCNIKNGNAKHDGDFMQWDMELQALWNTSDAGASGGFSPCRLGFQNLLAASTFQ